VLRQGPAPAVRQTGTRAKTESRSDREQEGGWSLLRLESELVSHSGERTHLTTKEWELLKLLSENCNEAVPRKTLLTELEYPNTEYGHRALESILYRLRRKSAETGGLPLKTYHAGGYGFMAPLTVR